ncbi:MAG TPA: hypothetical protein VFV35_03145 [Acidimicrobiales bacterium]|nr:hypothetical protein [Acidimicrobiales bacterium]
MAAERELVVQNLAYATLDALRAAVAVDLCAYLHVASGDSPQLYLRSPDLSSMTAAEAFDVFTSLRDALGAGAPAAPAPDGDRMRMGRYDAVAVRSGGPSSRGVFVVGRVDDPLTEGELAVVEQLGSAAGVACHAVEELAAGGGPAIEGSLELLGVAVRIDDGTAHADVSFATAGADVARGEADAATTSEAVALATIGALSPARKLAGVSEGSVAGETVTIVLVRDEEELPSVGAVLAGNDSVRAAAIATARAVAGGRPPAST